MIALALCMLAAAPAPDAAFDAFFAEFSRKRDTVQSLSAHFSQENVTPEETRHNSGTLYYLKPRRILFQYDTPPTSYLIDGQKVYQYEADLKQVQIVDLENDPQTEAFFLGFDDNTERLKQAYDLDLFTPEPKQCGAKGLLLRPKPVADSLNRDEKFVEQVRITLDDAHYLPCRIEIVNDNDSKVTITVTDIKLNADASIKDLKLKVPEGTSVIENDVPVEMVGPGGALLPRAENPASAPPTTPSPVTVQELKAP